MILFASPGFGFVILPDEYSTGSSLMPQKKNPDAWELIRGKCGRVAGALIALLVTMKGLPSSYQRDLQEDKEPFFDAHDQALAMTRIAAGAIAATKFDAKQAARRSVQEPAAWLPRRRPIIWWRKAFHFGRRTKSSEACSRRGRTMRKALPNWPIEKLSDNILRRLTRIFSSALTVEGVARRGNSAGRHSAEQPCATALGRCQRAPRLAQEKNY